MPLNEIAARQTMSLRSGLLSFSRSSEYPMMSSDPQAESRIRVPWMWFIDLLRKIGVELR
jgi:hypothetical protein